MGLIDKLLGPRVDAGDVQDYRRIAGQYDSGDSVGAGDARRMAELQRTLPATVRREIDRRSR